MSENFTFRSSVNGFNRNDVVSYIENILKERETLLSEISKLEEKLKKKDVQINELSARLAVSEEKCRKIDETAATEAKLGAAMLEAKRFTDIIIGEAKEKASAIFDTAASTIKKASVRAADVSEDINKFNEAVNVSLMQLSHDMSMLSSRLTQFDAEMGLGKDGLSDVVPEAVTKYQKNDVIPQETPVENTPVTPVEASQSEPEVNEKPASQGAFPDLAGFASVFNPDVFSETFKKPENPDTAAAAEDILIPKTDDLLQGFFSSQPVSPELPVTPVEATAPAAPAVPTAPAAPAVPTAPAAPAVPTAPVMPTAPAAPVAPVSPEIPAYTPYVPYTPSSPTPSFSENTPKPAENNDMKVQPDFSKPAAASPDEPDSSGFTIRVTIDE